MQFDKDLNSEFSEVFLKVRSILLKHNLQELQRENITSYFSEEGGICYLRTTKDKLVMGVFKGSLLEEKFPLINNGQKIIRHLYFRTLKDVKNDIINDIVKDSIIINIEKYEQRKTLCKKKSI